MKLLFKFFVVFVLFCIADSVNGQVKIDLKKKINNQVNNRANQRTDQGIDKGLDAVEGGVKEAIKNDKEDQTEQKDQDKKQQPDQPAKEENTVSEDPAPKAEQTPLQTYSKYDFIPGEKVIFYEDFSQDAVGDFPALWNTNGSGEVVTTNLLTGKWLQFITSQSCIWTDALLQLPENYTIEFDIIPIKNDDGKMQGYGVRLLQANNAKAYDPGAVPGKAGMLFDVSYSGRPGYRTYINGEEGYGLGLSGFKDDQKLYQKLDQKYHIAFWIQKSRVRIYQNETKMFDLPKAFSVASVKMDRLRFDIGAALVSNIRIAVGAPDLRNKLLTEGKLVSYGIYFDVNKEVVKPESYGTLKGIAAVLTENPDVKIKIVGHTDADGADVANLELSKKRGASVKNELVKNFGIDASRIESDGMGESQPVATNDTPANKALNRRVEFIKL